MVVTNILVVFRGIVSSTRYRNVFLTASLALERVAFTLQRTSV